MDEEQSGLHRRAQRLATLAAVARPVQHDINNLLTVIFANLEMLKRTAAEGAPQRQLDRIQEAARRFEATSRAVLSLARRPVPGEGEVTLAEAVTALRPLMLVLLPGPGALELALGPEAWPVRLDRARLDEALLGLAAEMGEGGARNATLGLEVANRPGRAGVEDRAVLTLRLPAPPPEAVLEALRAIAREAGGALEEEAGAATLHLLLPRQLPAATPA